MTLTNHDKQLLEEYSDLCDDELLYEIDQSNAYLDAGYSSTYHTDRIKDIQRVLALRTTNTPMDDCTHWVGNLPKETNNDDE
jgi:hypothetical protein